MFYNHYAVLQGSSAPNTKAMAQLYRPDHGSPDHFGYQTLTFTLTNSASPYLPAPIPPAPTGLTAQTGVFQVTLNWAPSVGDLAQGCNVLRATTSGGPYTDIATWIANTYPSYIDTNVGNGTTYYYVISAINQSGVSANSVEVSATPTTSVLPAGWTSQDVGVVTSTGSSVYAGAGDNTFMVTGYGAGIGGTGDGGFHFTYLIATNDFTLIARLTANNADQMGLMMRGSLATNAAEVQFFMANNARQSIFAVRSSNGGNLNHYNYGDQFTYPPAWYKLSRSDNNFTAYQSADGINWVAVTTMSVSAIPTSSYYVGLVINLGNATFDNVVYTNSANAANFAPPAAPANVTATAVASNLVYVFWASVTNASGYNIKHAPIRGFALGIASNITATAYYDTTTGASTTFNCVISAINGGGESTNSSQASATTPVVSAPAAPTGLTVAPGISQIGLNWIASIGASSYNVKRSTNNAGPFTNIVASGVLAAFTDTNVTTNIKYYYVVSAVNAVGESPNSFQVSAMLGTIIGTPGSWQSLGHTASNAFDGNLNTYFDGPDSSGDWVGLDFGTGVSNVIGFIQYCPRATYASRMVGGVFQGANNPNFTSPVILFTVTATPAYSVMTSQSISVANAFRYVRYLGPNSANCNVAEIEFDGNVALPAPPLAPTGLTASPSDGQANMSWNASAGATGYNLKCSMTSGGSYNVIANNLTSLAYTNTGLVNGISYYYVVSAVNAGGEGANSTQSSVIPVSLVQPQLAFTINGNQLQFNWPTDHLGWTLQAQTNLLSAGLGTNWTPMNGSSSTNQMFVPINPENASEFFRLIYP
jgi:fibronectin type 3 domain-containing protein